MIKDESDISIGKIIEEWNTKDTKILRYKVEVIHHALNEHMVITAPYRDMLKNKIDLQRSKWEAKQIEIANKMERINSIKACQESAIERTNEINHLFNNLNDILLDSLKANHKLDWNNLRRNDIFPESFPVKPNGPYLDVHPEKPDESIPALGLIDKIFKSKRQRKIQEVINQNLASYMKWQERIKEVDYKNAQILRNHEAEISVWKNRCTLWEEKRKLFFDEQVKFNERIEALKSSYDNLEENAILEYINLVLNNSYWPDILFRSYEIEYKPETKILIVEYQLPAIENIPKTKEVKYIMNKNILKETLFTEMQINKIYDDLVYKITLKTIYELFNSDAVDALTAISFNGWVESLNKATGKLSNNCILTIQVKKSEFNEINLSGVDPKLCFKNLKGVSASKLSTLTPIQPILQTNREDKRFIDSYDVASNLDESTNIAAMDWEDFEHLIREIFEKEFQSNGGEVKVTQASRDGGVDVIAFDPDPIRGGKIVIQAKRYTNTVGVSAVRDLFGTVMNEGATKGILVSTADYGPDAYSFAKDKPLTLLNGSNLLHLLDKHGYHARIDLREAKRILLGNVN